ncbi:MAG: peptidoglycan-binding protein [Clostridia bacterium]|nr:peptidoglycan-binding protein [Clostridia bacterium]
MDIIRRGDRGEDVVKLQTALVRAGYDPGKIDGVFGPKTEEAVKRFQRAMDLTVDGIVGSRSWAALAPYMGNYPTYPDNPYPPYPPSPPDPPYPELPGFVVLRRGDRGPNVTRLQTALTTAGYDVGPIDGIFGTRTEDAVKRFERVFGLTVDGVVDTAVWERLNPFLLEPDPNILRRGSVGTRVEALQRALLRAGFNPGTIDGLFGTRTQAALIAFQNARSLPATGVYDAATAAALAPYYNNYATYTVQQGDTLFSIARRFNTTVDALVRANPRANPNLIYVGERLIIPLG